MYLHISANIHTYIHIHRYINLKLFLKHIRTHTYTMNLFFEYLFEYFLQLFHITTLRMFFISFLISSYLITTFYLSIFSSLFISPATQHISSLYSLITSRNKSLQTKKNAYNFNPKRSEWWLAKGINKFGIPLF